MLIFCCFIWLVRLLQWLGNCKVFIFVNLYWTLSQWCGAHWRWYGDQNNGEFGKPAHGLLLVVNANVCRIAHRFRVIRDFHYNGGFLSLGAKICGFVPKIPLNGQVSTRLPKGTSLHGNTCFWTLVAAVWRAVRPVRVEKKVGKKKLFYKAQSSVYISSHHPNGPLVPHIPVRSHTEVDA